MIFIDTDVMVDVLRRYDPAIEWLDSLGSEVVGLPGLVAMELLQGCRDREEEQQVEGILRPYKLYWPAPEDCARAFDDFSSYHLSHGLGILDALIAGTAVGLPCTACYVQQETLWGRGWASNDSAVCSVVAWHGSGNGSITDPVVNRGRLSPWIFQEKTDEKDIVTVSNDPSNQLFWMLPVLLTKLEREAIHAETEHLAYQDQ